MRGTKASPSAAIDFVGQGRAGKLPLAAVPLIDARGTLGGHMDGRTREGEAYAVLTDAGKLVFFRRNMG